MKWIDVIKTLIPVVLALAPVPGGAALGPIIARGIDEAEQLRGASGPDKRAHALNLVAAGAAGANAVKGDEFVRPDVALAIAGHVIDTVVDSSNLIVKGQTKVVDAVAAAPEHAPVATSPAAPAADAQ